MVWGLIVPPNSWWYRWQCLTFMGLPCPNLGTSGFNYHGPYEYCSLTMMEKQVQILLHILKALLLNKQ